jgi:hypothetical protein
MANKSLIIGGASNYTWEHLKYWVNSIKKSGFTGDVVLVASNITKETIDKLTEKGVIVSLYGEKLSDGSFRANGNGAPHVERFFYIWNHLRNCETYANVILTDTRDVIFQLNPESWLDDNLISNFMVCSSEGLRYVNEPWGNQNLLQAFGPFFHNLIKDKLIFNVGTIAGDHKYVEGFILTLFQMCINRPIPIVDQAVFNFMVNTHPYNNDLMFTNNTDEWAIQLGTTLEAVKAGKGDLGMIFEKDPAKYQSMYEDNQPKIGEDGIVRTASDKVYTIVHQYDRVPHLKTKIENLYGDNDA